MPGWEETESEWVYALRDPADFIEGGLQRNPVENSNGVSLTAGKLRPEMVAEGQDAEAMVPQSLSFDKGNWSDVAAKYWLTEHPEMQGGNLQAARVALSLEGAHPPARIRIFKRGETRFSWLSGKQGRLLVDDEAMRRAVDHFEARGHDMVIDYEHQSEQGQVSPAAGWVKKLQSAADGLWAAVEWTKRAADFISNREYRYISPVIYFDSAARLCFLSSLAITNQPATLNPEPLVASYGAEGGPGEKFTAAELRAREDALKARLDAGHARESFIAKLTHEGRFPFYWRDLGVADFLEKLEGAEGRVQLSGEGAVNLADWFQNFLAKLPPHVTPGKLSLKKDLPGGNIAEQLDQLTVVKMRQRPYMTYQEAFAAVHREQPHLAQLYLSERDQK